MVIHDFSIEGVAAVEPKQTRHWQPQVFNLNCGVKLGQAHHSPFQNLDGQATRLSTGEKSLRFGVGESPYHARTINKKFI